MGKKKDTSNKYFQIARKYLDLVDKYYYEFDPKADSEIIFENNFKYEVSLMAFGFNLSINYNNDLNPYIALFGRKIIEDYYLYKLKDTKYLSHSNFKLFKLSSCKQEVGTRALKDITEEFKIPPNVIKKRMFDNDFWLFGNNYNSLENFFSYDYGDSITESEKELHHHLYTGLGILLHSGISSSLNINSVYEIINKLAKEIVKDDYNAIKTIKSSIDNDIDKFDFEKMHETLEKLYNFDDALTYKKIDLRINYIQTYKDTLNFLLYLIIFYSINKFTKPCSVLIIKPFVELLAYNYELLNILNVKHLFLIKAYYDRFIKVKVKSVIENKSLEEYSYVKENKTLKKAYEDLKDVFNISYEEFVDIYTKNPEKLINKKYNTYKGFVTHFVDTFNKSEELKRVYQESLKLTHSFGLIQNHEFNYKKLLLDLFDVVKTYLNYYSLIVLSRDYVNPEEKGIREEYSKLINKCNCDFNEFTEYIINTLFEEEDEKNNIS